jgi:hypothetical protein
MQIKDHPNYKFILKNRIAKPMSNIRYMMEIGTYLVGILFLCGQQKKRDEFS